MPYSTLILTARISAFAPRNALGTRFRETGSPLTFPPKQQNPVAVDSTLDERELLAECREFARSIIKRSDDLSQSEISAEFSMLHAIATHGKGLSPGSLVHLIHTPTLAGRLAVALQTPILESRLGVQVHPVELCVPFDPAQPGGLALASGAFIGQVSALLRHSDPHQSAFAPIGGYKSMVALGQTAASFHGFPSLYLHEDSQILQEIAPAPISISAETRAAVASAARRIGNGAEWSSLIPVDQQIVQSFTAFFTRSSDLVELNELGHFLRLDEIPVRLSPQALGELVKERPLLTKQLHQLRNQAGVNSDHPGINHDWISVKGRDHPWRIAQMGDSKRYAWQMIKGELFVYRIWRNHPEYENEAKSAMVTTVSDNDLATWSLISE